MNRFTINILTITLGFSVGYAVTDLAIFIHSRCNKPQIHCYETKYYSITKYVDGTKKRWLVATVQHVEAI